MIEIVAIRFSGGREHEHVSDVLWRGASTVAFTSTSIGQSSTLALVDWLSARSEHRAVVDDGEEYLEVAVVRPVQGQPHLRARDGERWSEALLALPTF